MGLAGPKKRTKISHDPNNSTWTSSTSRYGHRLLTSSGWTPGTTLGAKNAAHSAHYTAGSEAHIRIAPCVEGKGLGAKRTTDDTFGLRVLSGLLGRLNGQDTSAIESQLDQQRGAGYIEQRGWGLHFVFGGYLLGDKIEKTKESYDIVQAQQISKKRKQSTKQTEDRTEKRIKREPTVARGVVPFVSESTMVTIASEEDSKDRVKRRRLRKEAKIERRKAKELRREQRKLRKAQAATARDASESDSSAVGSDQITKIEKIASSQCTTTSSARTALFSGARGRHAMRQKYIDQKRMACMDDKALEEIFMIKQFV